MTRNQRLLVANLVVSANRANGIELELQLTTFCSRWERICSITRLMSGFVDSVTDILFVAAVSAQ